MLFHINIILIVFIILFWLKSSWVYYAFYFELNIVALIHFKSGAVKDTVISRFYFHEKNHWLILSVLGSSDTFLQPSNVYWGPVCMSNLCLDWEYRDEDLVTTLKEDIVFILKQAFCDHNSKTIWLLWNCLVLQWDFFIRKYQCSFYHLYLYILWYILNLYPLTGINILHTLFETFNEMHHFCGLI